MTSGAFNLYSATRLAISAAAVRDAISSGVEEEEEGGREFTNGSADLRGVPPKNRGSEFCNKFFHMLAQ